MSKVVLVGVLFLAACSSMGSSHDAAAGAHAADAAFHPPAGSAQEPLQRLIAGNQRFQSGATQGAGRDAARRAEVAKAQHPFAIVLTCADSRVSPEIVFDAGLGELFVVRSAGHVIDDHALGSIEYAAEHLHAHTLLVVGHERCGAVAAAMQGGELPGHIGSLVTAIQPGIAQANRGNAATDACVKANVLATVAALQQCNPILSEMVHKGELTVRGAVYDLDTGAVEILDETPAKPH